jgi:hypothetical protein
MAQLMAFFQDDSYDRRFCIVINECRWVKQSNTRLIVQESNKAWLSCLLLSFFTDNNRDYSIVIRKNSNDSCQGSLTEVEGSVQLTSLF